MWLLSVASLLLILVILIDAFEATVLPRQVLHRYRFVRLYYRTSWASWRTVASWMPSAKRREAMLAWFGPLSLLGLFATWVVVLIFSFALLDWSLDTPMHSIAVDAAAAPVGFGTYLYWSGVTFFTLGYGDVTPVSSLGRALAVIETGLGFGFLAMVISYVPVLYQAFSRREVMISLLDARAGSPPSAGEVLMRLARAKNLAAAEQLLAEWERWSAELLESHLSFPLLSYYRSQHDNQSWLAAVTTMLDTCALILSGIKAGDSYRAQLTFAMARHAVVDLSLVLKINSAPEVPNRLTHERFCRLWRDLEAAGIETHGVETAEAKLTELRKLYEPFALAMSRHFLFTMPEVVLNRPAIDNWQRSAWMGHTPGLSDLALEPDGEHF
jgi:voltage-gated potassium channel Kch